MRRPPQRGHGPPPLPWTARWSRTCFSNVGGTRDRRTAIEASERTAHRVVEGVDLLRGQRRPLAERQEPRREQDLVAVRVADPGDERLVAQQVLELARMTPDPVAPDLEGQRRIERIRTHLAGAPTGDRPLDARRAAGRPCPSASGRGSGPPVGRVGRDPRRARDVQGRVGGQTPPAGRRRGLDRHVLAGSFSPRPASWKRPVSIGLTTTRSSRRGQVRGTCHARTREALSGERGELRGGAPHGQRISARASPIGPVARSGPRGGHRRPRSDRAIRARRGDCSRRKACARLSRPQGHATVEEHVPEFVSTKERTAGQGHPRSIFLPRRPWSVAQAVRDSRARIHHQE